MPDAPGGVLGTTLPFACGAMLGVPALPFACGATLGVLTLPFACGAMLGVPALPFACGLALAPAPFGAMERLGDVES